MKESSLIYVGMDVHKTTHQVCMIFTESGEIRETEVANTKREIHRWLRKVKAEHAGEIRVCYEAGPCGFELQRTLEQAGVKCEVIAPSLIPVKPGERVKTDRRDARRLAEYYRQGLLTPVHPPTVAEEGVRDLCRCRESAKQAQRRARQHLEKVLLRYGLVYTAGSHWTQGHWRWLREQRLADVVAQYTLEEYVAEVERCGERVERLEQELSRIADTEPYREAVGWLRCFRGIDTVTAMTVVSELFGFERFREPSQLMAFLGLTPSESSSGGTRRQGGITKTGNGHVRRVLVEAAWHQRHGVRVSKGLKQRRRGQPAWVIGIADKAMRRLHKRFQCLTQQGKPLNVAVAAVARELAGFIWAVLYPGSRQTETAAGTVS